jgi:hypothetical protein
MKATKMLVAVGLSATVLLAAIGIGRALRRREAGKRDAEAVNRWEGEGGPSLPEGRNSVTARPVTS